MVKLVTPVGEAGFNSLKEARSFDKKEDSKKNYSITLILTKKDGEEFVKRLQEVLDKSHAIEIEKRKAKGEPARLTASHVNYRDLEDGRMSLNFKRAEVAKAPVVVDANKQPTNPILQRGSQVKVGFEARPYVFNNIVGLSLVLEAVQVMSEGLTLEAATELFKVEGSGTVKKETSPAEDLF